MTTLAAANERYRRIDLRPMENERFLDRGFCVAAVRAFYGEEGINRQVQGSLVGFGYYEPTNKHVAAARRTDGDAAAMDKIRELLASGQARREYYDMIDACASNRLYSQGSDGQMGPAWLDGGFVWLRAAVIPVLGSDYRTVLANMRLWDRHSGLLIVRRFDWPRAKIEKAAAGSDDGWRSRGRIAVTSLAEVEALIPDEAAMSAPVPVKEPIRWSYPNGD
jgi:hypothetical protein